MLPPLPRWPLPRNFRSVQRSSRIKGPQRNKKRRHAPSLSSRIYASTVVVPVRRVSVITDPKTYGFSEYPTERVRAGAVLSSPFVICGHQSNFTWYAAAGHPADRRGGRATARRRAGPIRAYLYTRSNEIRGTCRYIILNPHTRALPGHQYRGRRAKASAVPVPRCTFFLWLTINPLPPPTPGGARAFLSIVVCIPFFFFFSVSRNWISPPDHGTDAAPSVSPASRGTRLNDRLGYIHVR